jgi:hypothetical protein
MQTASDFLDAIRAKLDLQSDGQLARYLDVHRQHISKFRTGSHTFDDAMSCRVADLLKLDCGYVLACMQYHRAKVPAAKSAWLHVASMVGGSAAALVLVFAVALPHSDSLGHANAGEMTTVSGVSLYIMSNKETCAPPC